MRCQPVYQRPAFTFGAWKIDEENREEGRLGKLRAKTCQRRKADPEGRTLKISGCEQLR